MKSTLFQEQFFYEPLPECVIDRNGLSVDITSDVWRLNVAALSKNAINLKRVIHPVLRYALSRYFIFGIERLSPSTVISNSATIFTQLKKVGILDVDISNYSVDVLEEKLINAVNETLSDLRNKNQLDQFYEMSRWYMWSSDHIPDCGFSEEYALVLSRIKIPGDIKGEAVRSKDPESGPLHFELEEPLVRRALLEDSSQKFEHRQQRLAVLLCLAFGRNPLNYARLREEDFFNLTEEFPESDPLWQLKIPRIKKRSNPRQLFRAETCDKKLAEIIEDLIVRNQQYSTLINGVKMPRPLFFRESPSFRLLGTDSQDYAFHKTSSEILHLVAEWAERMEIISPITNKILHLTPRRLRYTFACNMARQGASRAALAEMLDHTDTQHVSVYFELFDELVGMLDKALALKIGKVLGWFKGHIVDSDAMVTNGGNPDKHLTFVCEENPSDQVDIGICGKASLCHLDPPYSCYLCPKFQPYRHADHEHVLDVMLSDRVVRLKRYEQARLTIQLDDVIYAVAQVAATCKGL